MTAPVADELLPIVEQVIEAFVWQRQGPRIAALGVLGQPFILDALAAASKLAAVKELHQPRQWTGSDVTVCNSCQTGWPCPTTQALT